MSTRTKKRLRKSTNHHVNVLNNSMEFEEELTDDYEDGTPLDDDIIIPPPQQIIEANMRRGLPRIIITHIVNENFKSYFGKVIVGPFHKDFSCVIGPNGSGKSNVIDSIMFVFGFRSNKIRSKDLRSLIHNSEAHKNVDKCTVEVHFIQIIDDTNGHYAVVSNSKFAVSRTACKDGTSYYKIDNKKVTFKEVINHLRKYGIDLVYNRFLILQGEVEKISLMKPKKINENDPIGMLEYIEDIIGTTRYKEPLIKLNDKFRTFQGERHTQLEQVKKVQSELDILKGPMKIVVDYFETKNNISKLNNQKVQCLMYQKNIDIQQNQEKQQELDIALKNEEELVVELNSQRKQLEKQLKEIRKHMQGLQAKYEANCTDKNEIRRKLDDLEKMVPDLESKKKKLEQDRKRVQSELERLQQSIVEKREKKSENENKISEMSVQINRLKEDVELADVNFNSEVITIDNAKGKFIANKDKLYQEVLRKRNLYESAKSDFNGTKKTYEEHCNKLSELKREYNLKSEELESKQKLLEELSVENDAICQELAKHRDALLIARNAENEHSLRVEKLRGQLKEQQNVRRAYNISNKILKFMMDRKADGTIPGIIGRLGNLGAIDKKYDVAVSMGCGLLDHIVVDTTETSTQCLKLLKQHNIGQCGFISLNALRDMSREMANIPNVPNAERIFDLIQISEPRFRPAFYFGLHDTLVVDNINTASNIGYQGSKKYRVVTLVGDVIDTIGTMSSSGNSKPISGKMGTTILPPVENTGHLEEQLKQSEIELSALRNEVQQHESSISSLESRLSVLKRQINDLNKVKQSLPTIISKLKEEITKRQKDVQASIPDPSILSEMEKKIEITKKEMEKVENELHEWDDKIKDADNRKKAIRLQIMKSPEARLKQAEEQERSISSEKNTLNNEIINFERKINQLTTKLENMENEQSLQARKEAIEDEKKTLITQLEELAVEIAEYDEQLNADKTAIEAKENDFRQIESEYNDLQSKISKKQNEKDVMVSEFQILHHNLKDLEHQLKRLKLDIVPDISDTPPDESSADANNQLPVKDALQVYTADEIGTFNLDELDRSIAIANERLHSLSPNLNIVDEFTNVKKKLFTENGKFQQISRKCNQYAEWYDDIKNRRISEFNTGFAIISKKVKALYQMLTLGGDADLELKDVLNPFSEGIELSVRPPKKSWKKITKLSGGEKTLTSLTLVFALHDFRPTPFYFMDEIDAALDEVNSCIIGHFIKKITMAQFIVISLRSPMFSLAPRIIGIFKVDDCTSSLTINNRDANDTRIYNEQATRTLDEHNNRIIQDRDECAFC